MSTPLSLSTTSGDDGKLVLIAVGEIDLSNVDAFSEALSAAISEAGDSEKPLTVNLSDVEYLDSAAINALAANADHIRLIVHPVLMTILKVSGLPELVTIEPAPEQL